MSEQKWPPAEEWAWEQIRIGKIADFNQKCRHLDPTNGSDEQWNDPCRAITPSFLVDMLARDDVPRSGVRLVGIDRKFTITFLDANSAKSDIAMTCSTRR